jgi:hypothetical protein
VGLGQGGEQAEGVELRGVEFIESEPLFGRKGLETQAAALENATGRGSRRGGRRLGERRVLRGQEILLDDAKATP